MALYENIFIARPDISAQRMHKLVDDFGGAVKNKGGAVARTEYWGLRNLAYRIRKHRKAHYAMLNLDAPHEAVAEMERQMRLHEDVLRFLTVKVDALASEPSAPMQQKERAEAREAERHQTLDAAKKSAAAEPQKAKEEPAAEAGEDAKTDDEAKEEE